jgi:hypothetical protein
MFKSSENLRLAAEMRALERVAAPWREARASWFDGTPDSIAARLAATERVLTHARAGYTGAHVTLEREASTARAELLAAQHRLMTDFLDDGARAFKGSKRADGEEPNIDDDERDRNHQEWNQWAWQSQSPAMGREDYTRKNKPWLGSKRVAGEPIVDLSSNGGDTGSSASMRHRDDRENNRYTIQRIPDTTGGDTQRAITNHDDTELMSADGVHHWAGRRVTADETTGFAWQSDDPLDDDDPYFQDEDFRRDADDLHALEHKLRHGPHDDDDPARYSSRTANAEWQARQESELDPEMRGNYYDGPSSGDCRHCGERIEERGSGGYGHVLGEDPHTGDTTYYPDDDHPAEPDDEDYHTASRRTATVADFDDQLLFDS